MEHIQSVPFDKVHITGGFWKAKQELNSKVTINAVYDRFYDTGRVGAFACKWKPGDDYEPHVFWDSDVAKWMEGVAYIITHESRPELEAKVEAIIDDIEANQWEDGYINSHFTVKKDEPRFTGRNHHELYCCGHLIEASVAWYKATGRDRFMKIMCRYADLVYRYFLVEDKAPFVTPGHEEIELALLKLYRATGEERYLELASFFLNKRGNNEKDEPIGYWANKYYQQDEPIRKQRVARGHSVRAGYLYSGMADLAAEENDEELLDACRALFDDINGNKLYITGGTGSTSHGESFTVPYDLPAAQAYAETCAGISLIYFCHRLLKAELRSDYDDMIERILYNGFMSGLSLDGKSFFYENPLEISLTDRTRLVAVNERDRFPITQRVEVFGCSCCPPNVNRLLASVGDYIYSRSGDTLIVHQYMESEMEDGGMTASQHTSYPNNGKVKFSLSGVGTLKLRVPGWCDRMNIDVPHRMERGFAVIENPPAELTVEFCMEPVLVHAHPGVRDAAERVAVMYGPVVYCAEGQDNGGNELWTLRVNRRNLNAVLVPSTTFDLPEMDIDGFILQGTAALYSHSEPTAVPTRIHMIPYYGFANRGEDNMAVWLW